MAAFSGTGAEKEGGGQATLESHLPDLGMSVPELVRVDAENGADKSPSRCSVNGVIDEVIVTGATSKTSKILSSSPSTKSSDSKEFHPAAESNRRKRRRRKGDKMGLHSAENSSSSSVCSRKKAEEKDVNSSSSKVSLSPADAPVIRQSPEESSFTNEDIQVKIAAPCSTKDTLASQKIDIQQINYSNSSASGLDDLLANQKVTDLVCSGIDILPDNRSPFNELTIISGPEHHDNLLRGRSSSSNEYFSELGTTVQYDFITELLLDHMDFVWNKCGIDPLHPSPYLTPLIIQSEKTIEEGDCKKIAMNLVGNDVNGDIINELNIINKQMGVTEEDIVSFEHQADRSEFAEQVIIRPLITDILQTVISTMKDSVSDCKDMKNYEGNSSDLSGGRVFKNVLTNGSQPLRLKASAVLSLSNLNAPVTSFELHFRNHPWIDQASETNDLSDLHILKVDKVRRSRHVRTIAMNNYSDKVMRRSIDHVLKVIVARLNFVLGACGQPHEKLPFCMRPLIFDGKHMTIEEIYNELEMEITETALSKSNFRSIEADPCSGVADEVIMNTKSSHEVVDQKIDTHSVTNNSRNNTTITHFIEALLLDVINFSAISKKDTAHSREMSSTYIQHAAITKENDNAVEFLKDDTSNSEYVLGSPSLSFSKTNVCSEEPDDLDVSYKIINDASLSRQFASTNLLKSAVNFDSQTMQLADGHLLLGKNGHLQAYQNFGHLNANNEIDYRKENNGLKKLSEEIVGFQDDKGLHRRGETDGDKLACRSDSESSEHSSDVIINSSEDVSVGGWSESDSSMQILNARKLYTIPEVSCESSMSEETALTSTMQSDESLYSAGEPLKQLPQNDVHASAVKFAHYATKMPIESASSETTYIVTPPDADFGPVFLDNASSGLSDLTANNVTLTIQEVSQDLSSKVDEIGQKVQFCTDFQKITKTSSRGSEVGYVTLHGSKISDLCSDTGLQSGERAENIYYDLSSSVGSSATSRETIQYVKPTATDSIQTDISYGDGIVNPDLSSNVLQSMLFNDQNDLATSMVEMNSHCMQTSLTNSNELVEAESTGWLNDSCTNVSIHEVSITHGTPISSGSENLDDSGPSKSSIPMSEESEEQNKKMLPTPFVKQTDPVTELLDEVCRDLTFVSRGICGQVNSHPMQNPLSTLNDIPLGGEVYPNSIHEGNSSVGEISSNIVRELHSAGDSAKSPSSGPSYDRFDANSITNSPGRKALKDICEHLKSEEDVKETPSKSTSNFVTKINIVNEAPLAQSDTEEKLINKNKSFEPGKLQSKKDKYMKIAYDLHNVSVESNNNISSQNSILEDYEIPAVTVSTTNFNGGSCIGHQATSGPESDNDAETPRSRFATHTMHEEVIDIEDVLLRRQDDSDSPVDFIHATHVHNSKGVYENRGIKSISFLNQDNSVVDVLENEGEFDIVTDGASTKFYEPFSKEDIKTVSQHSGVDSSFETSKPLVADNSESMLMMECGGNKTTSPGITVTNSVQDEITSSQSLIEEIYEQDSSTLTASCSSQQQCDYTGINSNDDDDSTSFTKVITEGARSQLQFITKSASIELNCTEPQNITPGIQLGIEDFGKNDVLGQKLCHPNEESIDQICEKSRNQNIFAASGNLQDIRGEFEVSNVNDVSINAPCNIFKRASLVDINPSVRGLNGLFTIDEVYPEASSEDGATEITIENEYLSTQHNLSHTEMWDASINCLGGIETSSESQKVVFFEPLDGHTAISSSEDHYVPGSNSDIEASFASIHAEVMFAEGDIQRDLKFEYRTDGMDELPASYSNQKEANYLTEGGPNKPVCTENQIYVEGRSRTGNEILSDYNFEIKEDAYVGDSYGVKITKGLELYGSRSNKVNFAEESVNHLSSFDDANSNSSYISNENESKKVLHICKPSVPDTVSSDFRAQKANNAVGLGLTFSNRNIFADICNETDINRTIQSSKYQQNDFAFHELSEKNTIPGEAVKEQIVQSQNNNLCCTSPILTMTPGYVENNSGFHPNRPGVCDLPQPLELSSYENLMNTVTHNKLSEDVDSECESLFELSNFVDYGQEGATTLGNNSSYEMIPAERESPLPDAALSVEDLFTPHLTSSNEDLLSKVTENDISESVSSAVIQDDMKSNTKVVSPAPSHDLQNENHPAIASWSYENLHHKSSAVVQQSDSTSSECLHIGITSLLKPTSSTSTENSPNTTSPESTESSYENVHARVIIEQPSSSTSSENSARIVLWSAGLSPKATSTESVQIDVSAVSSYENVLKDGLQVRLPSSASSDSTHQTHDSSAIDSLNAISHDSVHCADLSPSPLSSFENIAHEDVLPQSSPVAGRHTNIPRSETTLSTGSFEALAARASNSLHSAASHNSVILQSCSSGSSTCLYRSRARDFSGLMEYVGKLNSLANGRENAGDTNSGIARSVSTPVVESMHCPELNDESKSDGDSDRSSGSYKAVTKVDSSELHNIELEQSNSTVFSKLNALRRFMPFTCFLSPTTSEVQTDASRENSPSPNSNSKTSDSTTTTFDTLDQEID